MPKFLACLSLVPLLAAAAPTPALLSGYTRDAHGMCHKPGGVYVPCAVAAPAPTMQCKDGTFSLSKIVKTGCSAHGGVRKIL